jgi:glycerol-3-phosphate acyltransferase PlsX
VLKFTEGLAEGLFQTILSELQEFAPDLLGQFKPVMKKIYAKHDYQEHGGAPLLGVNGTPSSATAAARAGRSRTRSASASSSSRAA